jgi:hypothetical protein
MDLRIPNRQIAVISAVPELRPWRFNIVTNYSFTQGRLRALALAAAIAGRTGWSSSPFTFRSIPAPKPPFSASWEETAPRGSQRTADQN